MIKLFVSDMDGTLLNGQHTISPKTVENIKKLQASGIEFMIATGRTFASSKSLLQLFDIECELINLNGAAIYDQEGNILESIPLEKNVTQSLIEYCNNYHLEYTIMTENNIYVNNKEIFMKRMNDYFKSSESIGTNITSVQFLSEFNNSYDVSEMQNHPLEHPLKMIVVSEKPATLASLKRLFEKDGSLDITSTGDDNLEITHIYAQKGFAIQAYANKKGWSMEEVATIGDSFNDRSMLKMAGYGFVMSNAHDELKRLTPYIAPSNEDDGVAKIIDDILLGKYV